MPSTDRDATSMFVVTLNNCSVGCSSTEETTLFSLHELKDKRLVTIIATDKKLFINDCF